TRTHRLRFFNPGDVKALIGLDRISRVVLHADEGDHAIARRLDLARDRIEHRTDAEISDLVLDQALGRVLQALLHFTDAQSAKSLLAHRISHHQRSKAV